MKKILYNALLMLSVVAFYTSCGDDDGAPVSSTPAADIAGTYSGTWTVTVDTPDGQTTETHDGTVDLKEFSQYVLGLTSSIPDISGEESKSAPVNAVSTTNGYFFSCTSDKYDSVNPYGKTVSGRVLNGIVTFVYTGEIKVGRKKYGATYSFEGTRP
ncbi:MAG: hypothetical protein IJ897_05180 [Prevotella sp.]|nr:hypothetical protein [Prevotella sp.]